MSNKDEEFQAVYATRTAPFFRASLESCGVCKFENHILKLTSKAAVEEMDALITSNAGVAREVYKLDKEGEEARLRKQLKVRPQAVMGQTSTLNATAEKARHDLEQRDMALAAQGADITNDEITMLTEASGPVGEQTETELAAAQLLAQSAVQGQKTEGAKSPFVINKAV